MRTSDKLNFRAKLDSARTKIMKDNKYAPITKLLLSRDDIPKSDLPCPNTASDGVPVLMHSEFVKSQPVDKYRQELDNMALDHVVNNFLVDCGVSSRYLDMQGVE